MCWIMPDPVISARTVVLPGSRVMHGRTFQPFPSIEAGLRASGIALAPPPLFPSGFSAEMERVLALDSKKRLLREKGFLVHLLSYSMIPILTTTFITGIDISTAIP